MKNVIFEQENKMWQAALRRDNQTFASLVSGDAVMVCGGYRCSGAEYAALIPGFTISSYNITEFEVVCSSDGFAQVCYIITTEVLSPEDADLAGTFRVTSTWRKKQDEWHLVFNMDSRLPETRQM